MVENTEESQRWTEEDDDWKEAAGICNEASKSNDEFGFCREVATFVFFVEFDVGAEGGF